MDIGVMDPAFLQTFLRCRFLALTQENDLSHLGQILSPSIIEMRCWSYGFSLPIASFCVCVIILVQSKIPDILEGNWYETKHIIFMDIY